MRGLSGALFAGDLTLFMQVTLATKARVVHAVMRQGEGNNIPRHLNRGGDNELVIGLFRERVY